MQAIQKRGEEEEEEEGGDLDVAPRAGMRHPGQEAQELALPVAVDEPALLPRGAGQRRVALAQEQ